MFNAQHDPRISRCLELAVLQAVTVDTDGTIDFTLATLDLGIAQSREEYVLVQTLLADASVFNAAYIRVQESDQSATGFTEVAVLPFKAGIQYVKIQRRRRYLKLAIDTLTATGDASTAGFGATLIQ